MTAIHGVNLLNHFFVLLLVGGAGYLTVFQPDQLNALVPCRCFTDLQEVSRPSALGRLTF